MDKLTCNRAIITIILMVLLVFPAIGQGTGSSKALKYFEKARSLYEKGDWAGCEVELKKAITADSTFSDAYIMMGDMFQESGNLSAAAGQYKKALRFNPERADIVCNLLANAYYSLEAYPEAIVYYRKVLEYNTISHEIKSSIQGKLAISETRKALMDNPVAFDPVNLGKAVNTNEEEYINALAADGSGLFFTRRVKNHGEQARDFLEDFYIAEYSGDTLEIARILHYPPGRESDAGALSISSDGRLIFFTSCFRTDSYGSCDLYFSEKTGEKWSVAKNMGPLVNSEFWDAQPSVSPDGKMLYFSSSRPGGSGGPDIWKSEQAPDGNWKKPVNLGPAINTSGSEMAPFIHFDNQTLYFSSGGHPGMGGADLFKSQLVNGEWTKPVNLGYPVNSSSDELVIIVDINGDKGFVSNNNLKGEGGFDIYYFELNESIKPIPVTYLKGRVFDSSSGLPLAARFELIDIVLDSVIISAMSDRVNGEFLVCLPYNRNYALNVSSEGYLFYSDHFPLNDIKTGADPVLKNIPLELVEKGKKMVLRNIFFNTDEFQLQQTSFPELEKLLDFLKANGQLKVEIGGHTDDQGTAEYNSELSKKRAKAVYDYLTLKGIDSERLTYKGYGEELPFNSNDSEDGRALNRRTEIRIL
jgi:flagellar motor protein MotB